jgi:hypothetical protein
VNYIVKVVATKAIDPSSAREKFFHWYHCRSRHHSTVFPASATVGS